MRTAACFVPHPPLQASPSKPEPGVGTCNLYFKAPAAPFPDNILYLDGTGKGLVNNCCFPSTVAPSYAPAGQVGHKNAVLLCLQPQVLGVLLLSCVRHKNAVRAAEDKDWHVTRAMPCQVCCSAALQTAGPDTTMHQLLAAPTVTVSFFVVVLASDPHAKPRCRCLTPSSNPARTRRWCQCQ
jgi:hypothetical protein